MKEDDDYKVDGYIADYMKDLNTDSDENDEDKILIDSLKFSSSTVQRE
jgi:hypothetical protein